MVTQITLMDGKSLMRFLFSVPKEVFVFPKCMICLNFFLM